MSRLAALAAALCVAVAAASDVTLATFDGTESTTLDWQTVNDPVMGGRSHSSLVEGNGFGVWEGAVEIVPFLFAPGFCTLRKEADFPSLASTAGIKIRVRETMAAGLTKFAFNFGTSHTRSDGGGYRAFFEVTPGPEMQDHVVKWTDFVCSFRGQENHESCVGRVLANELDDITRVGVGTAEIEHSVGEQGPWPFKLEIENMVALGEISALKTTRTLDMKVFV